MQAIVCVDRNWAIGRRGRLLFHIPADLAHFRRLTIGPVWSPCKRTVLMGRQTFDAIPGTLLGARNKAVLTSDPAFDPCAYSANNDIIALRSLEDARAYAAAHEHVWLIGGAKTYAALLGGCKAAYVTQVDCAYPGADAFFPNLDELAQWRCIAAGPWQEYENLKFRFCEYQNGAAYN